MSKRVHDKDLKTFKERLKVALRRAGLTARELERQLGEPDGAFTRVYSGRRALDWDLVERTARVVGVEPEALLSRSALKVLEAERDEAAGETAASEPFEAGSSAHVAEGEALDAASPLDEPVALEAEAEAQPVAPEAEGVLTAQVAAEPEAPAFAVDQGGLATPEVSPAEAEPARRESVGQEVPPPSAPAGPGPAPSGQASGATPPRSIGRRIGRRLVQAARRLLTLVRGAR